LRSIALLETIKQSADPFGVVKRTVVVDPSFLEGTGLEIKRLYESGA